MLHTLDLKLARLLLLPCVLAASAVLLACSDDDSSGGQGGAETPASSGPPTAPTIQPAPTLRDATLRLDRIDGLNQPTQVVFLGPDDLLVTEKTGNIVRVRGGQVEGPVLRLAANYADERGVLGLTLHPRFSENRYVYVYWTWTGEGSVPDGLFGDPSMDIEKVPALGNRIDRFAWDGQRLVYDRNIIELRSRISDLTLNRRRGNHNAGVIDFGPDGKLYAAIGDQNLRGRLQNVPEAPEMTTRESLVGVVLRLNDDGTVPPDNPFVSLNDEQARIFAYGLRNTFGFDFDPTSGGFWLQANGQASYDEIGRYQAGDNLGWIQLMGPPERFDDYKKLEIDTERKLDAPEYPPERLANSVADAMSRLLMLPGSRYRAPLLAWRYAAAPTALHFVIGHGLGGDYEGDMLVGDANTGSVYRFELTSSRMSFELRGGLADKVNDNDRNDLVGEMRDSLFAVGIPVTTDIETAPDGSVWITSAGLQALFHVTRR